MALVAGRMCVIQCGFPFVGIPEERGALGNVADDARAIC